MSVKGRMMCPVCEVPLSMTDRQGIEIDFCPDCRGVWLDRGELDKIIERSAPDVAPQRVPEPRGYDHCVKSIASLRCHAATTSAAALLASFAPSPKPPR